MMDNRRITGILSQMGCSRQPVSIRQFLSEEDNAPYKVWLLDFGDHQHVLKEAKGAELETYSAFFTGECSYAPRLYATANADGKDYLLMEYIPGRDMRICAREELILALDSLISMQEAHWNSSETAGWRYERSLEGRRNRGNYLNDPEMERVYEAFLQEYSAVPRTLCHDDLLPFNVILTEGRAVFIDWEVGGILPYPVSLARLIAHGEEDKDAFFRMREEDKAFAIRYYFDHFISGKGIVYEEYMRSMKLFLFYEYCEWVFLGNKYGDTDSSRFRSYLEKARKSAKDVML